LAIVGAAEGVGGGEVSLRNGGDKGGNESGYGRLGSLRESGNGPLGTGGAGDGGRDGSGEVRGERENKS